MSNISPFSRACVLAPDQNAEKRRGQQLAARTSFGDPVRWLGPTDTLRASIPVPGARPMEVFALGLGMLLGGDFQITSIVPAVVA